MNKLAAQPEATFRSDARPLFIQGVVQMKREPITRGPYATPAARRAKIPTLKQMNRQITANREELLRRAKENTRRLTGFDTF